MNSNVRPTTFVDRITIRAPFRFVGLVTLALFLPIALLTAAPFATSTTRDTVVAVLLVSGPLLVLWADIVHFCRVVTVSPNRDEVHVSWRSFLFRQRHRIYRLSSFRAVSSHLTHGRWPSNRLEFITPDQAALPVLECPPPLRTPTFWSFSSRLEEAPLITRLRPLLAQKCRLLDLGFHGLQATRPPP